MGSPGPPHDDAALLRAARTDSRAFEAFYERWAPPLHGWLRARLKDPESANDLTAETFAAALVGLGRFRGERPGEGVAWLWGIARNLLHQHYRTSRLDPRRVTGWGSRRAATTSRPGTTSTLVRAPARSRMSSPRPWRA